MKKLPLVLLYAGLQVSTSLPALAVANPVRASSVRATPSATTPLAQKNTTSTLRSTSNLTVKNSAEVKEPVVDVAITSANNVDTERVGGIKKNKAVSYVAAKPVTAGGSVDSRIDALQEQVFQLQNELIRKSEEVAELNSALNDKIENLDKKFVKDDELKTKLDVFVADNLEDKFVKDTDLTDKVDDIVKTKNFIKESDLSGRVDNLIGGKGYLTVADKSTLLDKIATTKQELGADITSARAAVIASAKKDKEDLESAINKAKIDAIDAADNAARSKFVHIADLEGNMEDFIDSKRIVTDTTDLSEKFGVFLDKEANAADSDTLQPKAN